MLESESMKNPLLGLMTLCASKNNVFKYFEYFEFCTQGKINFILFNLDGQLQVLQNIILSCQQKQFKISKINKAPQFGWAFYSNLPF